MIFISKPGGKEFKSRQGLNTFLPLSDILVRWKSWTFLTQTSPFPVRAKKRLNWMKTTTIRFRLKLPLLCWAVFYISLKPFSWSTKHIHFFFLSCVKMCELKYFFTIKMWVIKLFWTEAALLGLHCLNRSQLSQGKGSDLGTLLRDLTKDTQLMKESTKEERIKPTTSWSQCLRSTKGMRKKTKLRLGVEQWVIKRCNPRN